MHRSYLAIGAILSGLAVILGAFGAHGLEKITQDEKILHSFQTAVQYQQYHGLALLAVGMMFGNFSASRMRWAANCFVTGIILFSGSLYLLTFLKLQGSNAVKFIGPVTPVGGIFFIAGWLFLLVAVVKKK